MSHLQSLLLDDKIPSMWLDPVLYYINKGMIFKNELTKVFELNIFVCYVRAHNIYRDSGTNYFLREIHCYFTWCYFTLGKFE